MNRHAPLSTEVLLKLQQSFNGLLLLNNLVYLTKVSEIEWVSRDKLPEFLSHVENTGGEITPWFRLITQVC